MLFQKVLFVQILVKVIFANQKKKHLRHVTKKQKKIFLFKIKVIKFC